MNYAQKLRATHFIRLRVKKKKTRKIVLRWAPVKNCRLRFRFWHLILIWSWSQFRFIKNLQSERPQIRPDRKLLHIPHKRQGCSWPRQMWRFRSDRNFFHIQDESKVVLWPHQIGSGSGKQKWFREKQQSFQKLNKITKTRNERAHNQDLYIIWGWLGARNIRYLIGPTNLFYKPWCFKSIASKFPRKMMHDK